ncbi:MAG: hypothetical protein E2O39_01440 [Planctomycetota bacterium]|nr:MAG: hypothetical protein E2O39_01440 [Planctomycetota bacterium]
MADYEALRREWIARLTAHGELARLSQEKRQLLERGSLHVLLATQLAELERKRTFTRLLAWLAGCALVLAISNSTGALLGHPWLASRTLSSPPVLGAVLLGTVLAGTAHFLVSRSVERRRSLYLQLGETATSLRRRLR